MTGDESARVIDMRGLVIGGPGWAEAIDDLRDRLIAAPYPAPEVIITDSARMVLLRDVAGMRRALAFEPDPAQTSLLRDLRELRADAHKRPLGDLLAGMDFEGTETRQIREAAPPRLNRATRRRLAKEARRRKGEGKPP